MHSAARAGPADCARATGRPRLAERCPGSTRPWPGRQTSTPGAGLVPPVVRRRRPADRRRWGSSPCHRPDHPELSIRARGPPPAERALAAADRILDTSSAWRCCGHLRRRRRAGGRDGNLRPRGKGKRGIFCHANRLVDRLPQPPAAKGTTPTGITAVCRWSADFDRYGAEPYVYAQNVCGPHPSVVRSGAQLLAHRTAPDLYAVTQWILGIGPTYYVSASRRRCVGLVGLLRHRLSVAPPTNHVTRGARSRATLLVDGSALEATWSPPAAGTQPSPSSRGGLGEIGSLGAAGRNTGCGAAGTVPCASEVTTGRRRVYAGRADAARSSARLRLESESRPGALRRS